MNLPSALVRHQAAEWLAKLDEQFDDNVRAAFTAWLNTAPEHQRAVQLLQGQPPALQALPPGPTRTALGCVAPRMDARSTIKTLCLLSCLLMMTVVAVQYFPPSYLMTDISTRTGEWRSQSLPDGSRIRLDGRSAVNLFSDGQSRTLHLLNGAMLLEATTDSRRALRIVSEHGSIQTQHSRLILERLPQGTRLTVLDASVKAYSAGQSATVNAGEQVMLSSAGLVRLPNVDGQELETAWASQQLQASGQPLPDVLAWIARHHRGVLLFDPQALASLQVTAQLPGTDSEQALSVLADRLPLQVEHFTPWLTRISLRQP